MQKIVPRVATDAIQVLQHPQSIVTQLKREPERVEGAEEERGLNNSRWKGERGKGGRGGGGGNVCESWGGSRGRVPQPFGESVLPCLGLGARDAVLTHWHHYGSLSSKGGVVMEEAKEGGIDAPPSA